MLNGVACRAQNHALQLETHDPDTPLPYWAVALLMVPLQAVLPPLLAFRALVALYVVLLPLSFLVLARAARPPSSPAGATDNRPLAAVVALMAMNWAYFLGEANFFLGQPLVLELQRSFQQ